MIAIGASLGASKALPAILGSLPDSMREPIAVVVHRHRDSDHRMVDQLQRCCTRTIEEAVDKQAIEPGHVYLAPPDYHLLVQGDHFELSVDEMVNFARPSIDVFFESLAEDSGPATIGILLTGASSDGAKGLAAIKAAGGLVIVQDPADAECPVMPAAALALLRPDHVCRLDEIAALICRAATRRGTGANPA